MKGSSNINLKQYSGIIGVLLGLSYFFGFIRLQQPLYQIFGFVPFNANDYLIAGIPPVICGALLFFLSAFVYVSIFDKFANKLNKDLENEDYKMPIALRWFPITYFLTRGQLLKYFLLLAIISIISICVFLGFKLILILSSLFIYTLLFLDFWFGAKLYYKELLYSFEKVEKSLKNPDNQNIVALRQDIELLDNEITKSQKPIDILLHGNSKNHIERIRVLEKNADRHKEVYHASQWIIHNFIPFRYFIHGFFIVLFIMVYASLALYTYDRIFPESYPKTVIIDKQNITHENIRLVTIRDGLVYVLKEKVNNEGYIIQLSNIEIIQYKKYQNDKQIK